MVAIWALWCGRVTQASAGARRGLHVSRGKPRGHKDKGAYTAITSIPSWAAQLWLDCDQPASLCRLDTHTLILSPVPPRRTTRLVERRVTKRNIMRCQNKITYLEVGRNSEDGSERGQALSPVSETARADEEHFVKRIYQGRDSQTIKECGAFGYKQSSRMRSHARSQTCPADARTRPVYAVCGVYAPGGMHQEARIIRIFGHVVLRRLHLAEGRALRACRQVVVALRAVRFKRYKHARFTSPCCSSSQATAPCLCRPGSAPTRQGDPAAVLLGSLSAVPSPAHRLRPDTTAACLGGHCRHLC